MTKGRRTRLGQSLNSGAGSLEQRAMGAGCSLLHLLCDMLHSSLSIHYARFGTMHEGALYEGKLRS
eukprot:5467788-Amphidinium_carterae.2